jgi:RNA polymerase sigma-70 factor (ECF subfamily)
MRAAKKENLLVRRAQSGDDRAFGQLVQIYQNQILYLVYDFIGDYEQAQDIAQDIFVKTYKSIKSFEGRSSFGTWLKRIAINSCNDVLRKKKRMPENVRIKTSLAVSESPANQEENREIIDRAFASLSPNQYSAMVLRYFQDEEISEIAKIMLINENTVRIHIHRAMLKLRKMLKE